MEENNVWYINVEEHELDGIEYLTLGNELAGKCTPES